MLVLSPFLNSAVALACGQSRGTCPVLYDCWYIAQITGAISFDIILSILVGSRLGPDAFAGLKLLSSFLMPGAVAGPGFHLSQRVHHEM